MWLPLDLGCRSLGQEQKNYQQKKTFYCFQLYKKANFSLLFRISDRKLQVQVSFPFDDLSILC